MLANPIKHSIRKESAEGVPPYPLPLARSRLACSILQLCLLDAAEA